MSTLGCARVLAMEDAEEKYHWVVVFRRNQLPYTYKFRSVPYMVEVCAKHKDRYGVYPFRMWVIVDDEIQKVEIR